MESDRDEELGQVNQLEGGKMHCPRGMRSVACEHLTQKECGGLQGMPGRLPEMLVTERSFNGKVKINKQQQFTGKGSEVQEITEGIEEHRWLWLPV